MLWVCKFLLVKCWFFDNLCFHYHNTKLQCTTWLENLPFLLAWFDKSALLGTCFLCNNWHFFLIYGLTQSLSKWFIIYDWYVSRFDLCFSWRLFHFFFSVWRSLKLYMMILGYMTFFIELYPWKLNVCFDELIQNCRTSFRWTFLSDPVHPHANQWFIEIHNS